MIHYNLKIPELIVIEPTIYNDDRGFFQESFNKKSFEKAIGYSVNFVQDNHSFSKKNILRGIHYQLPPFAHGKLVRVVSGTVYDIGVDLRKNSPTFGRWAGEYLSDINNKQLWIPEGFGHAFYVISESAHFLYKTTNYYNKESEGCIKWNDPKLNIDWGNHINKPIVSNKDAAGSSFINAKYFD